MARLSQHPPNFICACHFKSVRLITHAASLGHAMLKVICIKKCKHSMRFYYVSVCTCVVHKRCHKLVITKCPGMRDEVSVCYCRVLSLYYYILYYILFLVLFLISYVFCKYQETEFFKLIFK